MQDLHGFLRHPREEAAKEHPKVRIRHWGEYVDVMPENQAARQANRCMDCGTPYCHHYCPVHNIIPEWNTLVESRDWRHAYDQLDTTNSFPEITGRLCPAPCENACTLSLAQFPVTIKNIELAVAERAWSSGWVQPQPSVYKRDQRVSVIGSGPAGLACAQQLARAGYKVTVFEKADRIGGLLRYGIPDFRLDKRIVDRRLQQLEAEGVSFRTGVHVGVSMAVPELQQSSDAMVLACGSAQPREVVVPGRELRGIHYALDFLSQQNRRVAGDEIAPASEIDARDKSVVVIGGGDTGSDCLGTAIRQGAKVVTQVQYHDRPSKDADVLEHWPKPVPQAGETDTEVEGAERIWGWDACSFEGSDGGINRVSMQRLLWIQQADGSWSKQPLPNQQQQMSAGLVLLALGYAHPVHAGLLEYLRVAFDHRGNVAANEQDYQTSVKGVFACGDVRRGQSLVVWAIREGRQCARAVDVWLSGSSDLPGI
ncbi:MAG: glutamate synthase subunit beta [gamma proteobacterium endosymbiont of Lamellibrachia anaximandri]|nr:glutamate synthase subunit beta [gamma proteobacterium endosymbiont of Lamellibrachia anaximandri]